MRTRDAATVHPGDAPHHTEGHRPVVGPIDSSYRLVIRTILWVIAGLVFLAFAIWWGLT